uniref:Variant surface glycoprotein 507 n=1 Tax=Trypanosoma brucei TaxID=5691 RepID=M4T071_9TRYP|nr:variant surface glycoprotein 507 [Trypanosoma brucei]
MTKPNQYTKATLVLIQILIGATESHGQGDIVTTYEASATKPCHEIVFLEKVIDNAKKSSKKAKDQIRDRANDAALLAAAMCGEMEAGTRAQYQALATLTSRQLALAINEGVKADKLTAPIAVLTARQAQTRLVLHRGTETAQPTISQHTGTNPSNIGAGAGTPKFCGFKITTQPAKHETCGSISVDYVKLQAAADNLKALKAIKLVPEQAADSITIQGEALHIGSLGTNNANFNGGFCSASGAPPNGATNNALGIAAVTTTALQTALERHQLGSKDEPNQKCVENTGEAYATDRQALTHKSVGRAICEIRDDDIATIDSYLDKDITDLIADPEAQKVAELLLTSNVKKDGDEDYKKDAVKKLFGTDKGSIREKLINPLNDKRINYKVNDENSKKTISHAANDAGGHAALAACYGQRHRDSLKKQAAPTATVSVEKCKPDTEESECKNDSDCDFSEGKCKFKEGVKAENDAKTTNTTRSNSFVINKELLFYNFFLE